MNRKVRKAKQVLDAACETYEKAAKDFLAAVEATPAEMEAADKIIYDDLVLIATDGLTCELMGYDEQVACAILDDLRGEELP